MEERIYVKRKNSFFILPNLSVVIQPLNCVQGDTVLAGNVERGTINDAGCKIDVREACSQYGLSVMTL
jgi:hypothetical protein